MDAIRRSTGAVRMLRKTYRLHTDQIRILITPDICKSFKENTSLGRCHKDIKNGEDVFADEKGHS